MVMPLPMWQKILKDEVEASLPNQKDDKKAMEKAYQNWIGQVAAEIKVSPPYLSMGTTDKSKFAPLKLPMPGTPATAALIYSQAWFNWYMAIQWQPHGGPPVPPFTQKVLLVVSSPSGAAAAKTKLQTDLQKEFLTNDKNSVGKKIDKMAQYFYQATIQAGVQISGLAIGSPPVPVMVPKVPVM